MAATRLAIRGASRDEPLDLRKNALHARKQVLRARRVAQGGRKRRRAIHGENRGERGRVARRLRIPMQARDARGERVYRQAVAQEMLSARESARSRTLDSALANLGSDVSRIKAQSEFVKQTEETVRIGLGALVDADLAKESANLTSLQVRQQLGVQAIGIANSAPQSLLGLFR